MTLVVLVDENDVEIGTAEKLDAHRQPPQLHRAFSAFLFAPDGRIVLQRRSEAKYHFGGLWANSCCGHPLPGESVVDAAARRSVDELGVLATDLRVVASVIYSAHDPESDLMEREYDHVVLGQISMPLTPDPLEVAEIRLVTPAQLAAEVERLPADYAPWVPFVLDAAMPSLVAMQAR
jgi:isopentenyl-diphosphate delta-isomerase